MPMMDCKRALGEAKGDIQKAIELLRKAGAKVAEKQAGRATTTGRISVFADPKHKAAAMIDLRCESAPVAANEQFAQLANDLAKQLALGPGAATPDALLAQPSPSQPGHTLKQQFDELNNRIREAFKLARMVRIDGACGGYAHHNAAAGVLLQIEGGNDELARDICMHVAALRPASPAASSSTRRKSIKSAIFSPSKQRRKANRKRLSPKWSKAACAISTRNAALWTSP